MALPILDTPRIVPEEPTRPNPEEAVRRRIDAANRLDFDGAVAPYSRDAVWDMTAVGLGVLEGHDAIRGFFRDFQGFYEEFEMQVEDFCYLDNGVTLTVCLLRGRAAGSSARIENRYAAVDIWTEGLIERAMNYTDIDEARAAAERLAAERG